MSIICIHHCPASLKNLHWLHRSLWDHWGWVGLCQWQALSQSLQDTPFDLKSKPKSTVHILFYASLEIISSHILQVFLLMDSDCKSNCIKVSCQENQDLSPFPDSRRKEQSQTRRKTTHGLWCEADTAPGFSTNEGGGPELCFSPLDHPIRET